MMQSGSERSLQTLLEALDETLQAGSETDALGADLFRVVNTLDREPGLRRTLTEPSLPEQARRGIARTLLQGKISDPALRVVEAAVGQRWSRTRDLVEALERCAVSTEAALADRAGQLDSVEDDLFRFGRILESSPQLRDALSNRVAPTSAKRHLIRNLLSDKVNSVTLGLLEELVAGRQRSLAAGLEQYAQIAASRRHRLVATVWAAAPLTDAQKGRIAQLLAAQYSHDIHVNVIVDPDLLGGVRVAVGDDVIDSTIQTRLNEATRQLAR